MTERRQSQNHEEPVSEKGRKETEQVFEVTKSPEGRPDIEVTFLYVIHMPKRVEYIWRKIEETGADRIILEQTGFKKKGKERAITAINALALIARETPDDPSVQKALKTLREEGPEGPPGSPTCFLPKQ